MLGADALDSLCELRLGVLDDMSLVKNTIQPVHSFKLCYIIPHDLVGGNDYVMSAQLGKQPSAFSGIAGVQYWPQILRILQYFVVPVASERWRADDEGWKVNRVRCLCFLVPFRALKVFARQNANRLQRLA